MKVRCSNLDRIYDCPASANPPAINISLTDDKHTRFGTGVHAFMRHMITGKDESTCQARELAAISSYEAEEFDDICERAWWTWRQVSEAFPDPVCEHTFPTFVDGEIELSGTCDVMSLVGPEVRIADWKSGWLDTPNVNQLKGYSWLAMQENPDIETARATKLHIRSGMHETFLWTREELAAWWKSLVENLTAPVKLYRPGNVCRYCPQRWGCGAHDRVLRKAAAIAGLEFDTHSAGSLAAAVRHLRSLEKEVAGALAGIKTIVKARGGEILDEAGNGLRIEEGASRSLITRKAWPILSDQLGESLTGYVDDDGNEVPGCVEIGVGRVEDAIKACLRRRGKLRRGEIGQTISGIFAALSDAGAIESKPRETLEVVTPETKG